MSRGVLGFQYEEEKRDTGMTGLAGLPVYLDLMHAMCLPELSGRHLQVKQRGWTDAQKRMKAIRFSFINIPGRIVERSRELIVRLVKGHPAYELYLEATRRIMAMKRRFMVDNDRESFRLNGVNGGFLEHNFPTGGESVFRDGHVTGSFGKLWKI
jgi:hypothetical protein